MTCNHRKLSFGRSPCATPGCENAFPGEYFITMEALPEVGSAADFSRIYIGPDGIPVHGVAGFVRRMWRREQDETGWLFGMASAITVPSKSAEEVCRELWREAELCVLGTDEVEAQP